MLPKDVLAQAEKKMKASVQATSDDLATLRTGRASPALLERIVVEYYGSSVPIKQLANISAPEPRLLVVSPWDKQAASAIEKAIARSDLGLMPQHDGNVIRLPIPQLTEERRKDLVKVAAKRSEQGRVAIRNIRRDAIEDLRKLEKSEHTSEDEVRRAQEQMQKITDRYIEDIDRLLKVKEAEIMEV